MTDEDNMIVSISAKRLDTLYKRIDELEHELRTLRGVKSCFVPPEWKPEPIMPGQVTIAPGVDVDLELQNFRLHEFAQPKSNWQNAWLQWLSRAKPPQKTYSEQAADTRKQTVSASESTHPALVAERNRQ